TRPAGIAGIETFLLRGDLSTADRELQKFRPEVDPYFGNIFDLAMWKRDYDEARRALNEAANYPQLEAQRWQKEMQFAFVTREPASIEMAREAEKRLEDQLTRADSGPEEIDLTDGLIALKLILGKKDEAIRLAEASLERHPVEEDAITNIPRLRSLA